MSSGLWVAFFFGAPRRIANVLQEPVLINNEKPRRIWTF
jgi:hypothetical protein